MRDDPRWRQFAPAEPCDILSVYLSLSSDFQCLPPSPAHSRGEVNVKPLHTKHNVPVGFRDVLQKATDESGALVYNLSGAPNPEHGSGVGVSGPWYQRFRVGR